MHAYGAWFNSWTNWNNDSFYVHARGMMEDTEWPEFQLIYVNVARQLYGMMFASVLLRIL